MWTQLARMRRVAAGAAFACAVVMTTAAVGALGQAAAPPPPAPARPADRPAGQNPVKDAWITFKIHSQFVPDAVLEGSDIDVTTRAGVVTLAGMVPTPAARTRALAIAKETDGVKSVTDTLRLGPATGGAGAVDTTGAKSAARSAARSVNDGWIKSKIYAQFLTDWSVFEDSDIDIDVASGMVTLNGTVRSQNAKTRAVALAKATDGVKDVKDNLKVSAS